MSSCRNFEVVGSRRKGRPKMTWRMRLDGDMRDGGLRPEMAMDREKWRSAIMWRTSDPHRRGNNIRLTNSSSSPSKQNQKNQSEY